MERLKATVARRLGLNPELLPPDRLQTTLKHRLRRTGLNANDYVARLETDLAHEEIGELASHLTVSETYFFRHLQQLLAVLELGSGKEPLRVLSAGCASGEEPYSLAILLQEHGRRARISAFDVNPATVARARMGHYSRWSLREVDEATRLRWFRPDRQGYRLDARIRASVEFHVANLLDTSLLRPGSGWDAIFCRNVLMYFPRELMRVVVERLASALAPDGALFLGHAETLRGLSDSLELCQRGDAFYYRRRSLVALPPPPSRSLPATAPEPRSRTRPRVKVSAQPESEGANPNSVALAWELLRQERFREALQALPAAITEEVQLLRCALLTHSGQVESGRAHCLQLARAGFECAGLYYLLGLCAQVQGRRDEAVQEHTRAAQADPTFALPHLQLGLLAQAEGDASEAQRAFDRAALLLSDESDERLTLYAAGFSREALARFCGAHRLGR